MSKQLVSLITCGCESSAPFISSPDPNYCHQLASVDVIFLVTAAMLIGLVLSEEKIFEKAYDGRRRRTPTDGNSSGQVS
jgi:hypothetical protein